MLPNAHTAPLARTVLVTFLATLAFGLPLAAAGLDQHVEQPASAEPLDLGLLSVPAPHQGDAAEYIGGNELAFSFAWVGTRDLPDREGRMRTIDLIVTEGRFAQDGRPGGWNGMLTREEFADATERRVSGYLMEGESTSGAPGCDVAPCEREEVTYKREVVHTAPDDAGRTPCGLFNRLQDATTQLSGAVALFDRCTWDPRGERLYRAVERWGNEPTVVRFLALDNRSIVREAWFSDASPYPVALDVAGRWTELANFARGETPLASAHFGSAPAASPAVSQVGPVGPAEPVSGHPFPLSVALEEASSHADAGDLRSWMDAHPGARPVAASGVHMTSNETEEWSWGLVLGDGIDAYAIEVARRTEPTTNVLDDLPPQEPFMQTVVLYEGSVVEEDDAATFAAPGEVDKLPSVDALWAVWKPIGEQAGRQATTWGFGMYDGLSWVAWGGDSHMYRSDGAGPGVFVGGQHVPPSEADMAGRDESIVRMSSSSVVSFEQDTKVLYAKGMAPTDPPAAAFPPRQAPAGAAPQTSDVRMAWAWTAPPQAAVAGAGLAVLAIGVLHHFFPGLLRMFSRVSEDEALEHPLRAQLMTLVQAEPGVHHKELARRTGRARGTVEHHLRKMEQLGLLRSRTGEGYRCYFPAGGTDRRLLVAAPRVRSAGAQAVLRALSQGPGGLSLSQAASRAGLGVSTAHYHVGRLEEAGLLAAVRRPGLEARLELTPLGRTALAPEA